MSRNIPMYYSKQSKKFLCDVKNLFLVLNNTKSEFLKFLKFNIYKIVFFKKNIVLISGRIKICKMLLK